MRVASKRMSGVLAAALLAGSVAHAQVPAASTIPPPRPVATSLPPAPAAPANAAWDSFASDVHDLWARLYQSAPKRLRDEPQTRAELSRLMLEALTQQMIEALGQDGDHPAFFAHINYYLNLGQPNADTIYKRAIITPGGVYRLRGKPGSLTIAKMAQLGPTPDQTGGGVRALAYSDFSKLALGADGRFDVILSPTRPAGYTGDWWHLEPTTSSLLLRQVSQDWKKEGIPPSRSSVSMCPSTNPGCPRANWTAG